LELDELINRMSQFYGKKQDKTPNQNVNLKCLPINRLKAPSYSR